jgi:DNA-binding cell septation regulator SpoVG
VENAGALRAYVSIRIGPLTIHDFRVIKQANQDPWVSVPQKSWNTPQGERKFSPLLDLPPEWKPGLTTAVIEAWEVALELEAHARCGDNPQIGGTDPAAFQRRASETRPACRGGSDRSVRS